MKPAMLSASVSPFHSKQGRQGQRQLSKHQLKEFRGSAGGLGFLFGGVVRTGNRGKIVYSFQ